MNRLTEMSDSNLERMLRDYAKSRKGEIADLTYTAAERIAELAARLKVLEGEDDLK